MSTESEPTIRILAAHKDSILRNWLDSLTTDPRLRRELLGRVDLRRDSQTFLEALLAAAVGGSLEDLGASEYEPVKRVLAEIARGRVEQGFTPTETIICVVSLKDHFIPPLLAMYQSQPEELVRQVTTLNKLVDGLGCVLIEQFIQEREEVIGRQSREILEISTPVIQMWDGVVVAPLIGTLDSPRTQQFMERLLERVVETGSPIALIDITGVPAIDTQTARHLIETISAVRLVGAQVIVTGVRPAIAQTLVHLGIDLSDITTRSSLAAGLRVALDRVDLQVVGKNGDR